MQAHAIHSRAVIAAHGSWELGPLTTERQHLPSQPADLLAFKAHFRRTGLPEGQMPLLSFTDGYGGMVHCDGGRASLSCCIRRDRLARLERAGEETAGAAVVQHILDSCSALWPILKGAELEGAWMSAGPIQPGVRGCYTDGVYVVGNAAGEAHPVVAEGISMAMQSAALLADQLIRHRADLHQARVRDGVGAAYTAAWRRHFIPRIKASAAIAQWAMRPWLVIATLPLLRVCPSLLTFGARLSGKAHVAVPSASAYNEIASGAR